MITNPNLVYKFRQQIFWTLPVVGLYDRCKWVYDPFKWVTGATTPAWRIIPGTVS